MVWNTTTDSNQTRSTQEIEMATFKFIVYRTARRFIGPVLAYRVANRAVVFLDATKPLVVVSCGAAVIHAAAISVGVI